MKRLLAALLLCLLCTPWTTTSLAQAAPPPTQVAGELLIKLRPGTTLSASAAASGTHAGPLNALLRQAGASQAQPLEAGSPIYRVQLRTSRDPRTLAAWLAASPAVAYAEPNHLRTVMRTPNDSVLRQQWALRNIRAIEAWDLTVGNEVTIAILDTGVARSHPDLSDKLLPGYDIYNNDGDPDDDEGHGTHTAGVAAAASDNGEGVAGVCWGCKILPVKVLGARGQGDDATIARGIRWAVDQGARIISMSLGGPEDTQVLREAVQYAHDHNALIIAASGNGQAEGNVPNYPAAYANVLAVSAVGGADVVTGFSTTGSYVGIAAPGVGVWSTLWSPQTGNSYGAVNGTSSACPHVAGVAGLVLSLRPDLSAEQLAQVLQASADDVGPAGRDNDTGYGRLNALRAVQLASDPTVLSQSRIQGTVAGGASASVALSSGQQTQADGAGFYSFAGLPTGGYTVTVTWPDGRQAQQQTWLSGTALSIATVNFDGTGAAPAPAPAPAPGPGGNLAQAFLPVPPPNNPAVTYFPETQHTLRGALRSYWQANGGLPIFGFAISEELVERGEDGRDYLVQYFERHRLEYHPENAPPYNVLLTRLGDTILRQSGRDWFSFPKGAPQPNCAFFAETGHSLCGAFLNYWANNGLELDGQPGKTQAESLALFGQPLSEPQQEMLSDGQVYLVQWFERGRFEFHEGQGVLLGLLGNEFARR